MIWLKRSLFLALLLSVSAESADSIELNTRSRIESGPGSGVWETVEKKVSWDPRGTAVVICDMWDRHWCVGATKRVGEMAPRMNQVVHAARDKGALIIHCPSGVLDFYKDTPQRKRAQSAPKVASKVPLLNWCHLDPEKEAPLPIDDRDGGCDEHPQCKNMKAWTRQIDVIDIEEGDAITDSAEAYYLMRQRGITNVLVMGVHLNMCVLGRPFSIRQMVNQGQNVVFVRDLVDTMYNSRKRPHVPHTVGTKLMVEHVEKYWAPSVTSVDFVGGKPFRFEEDLEPHIVVMIGEDEYKTWETLPPFMTAELNWRGFRTTFIHQDEADMNLFPGFVDAMNDADLLLVSVRRRTPPPDVLEAVRRHLDAGKPLVGIRTASHAFSLRGQAKVAAGRAFWSKFDPEVLGGNYHGHHGRGPKTALKPAADAASHPILTGVNLDAFQSNASLYKVSPLEPAASPLLIGSIPGQPSEPVAWTHAYGSRKAPVFYTSLGHPDDFKNPGFRRLLMNGILWAAGRPVPPAPPVSKAAAAQPQKTAKTSATWRYMEVPGTWEDNDGLQHDGFAWYRCLVMIPNHWKAPDLKLRVGQVDNVHEAFLNGTKLGAAGAFPPNYQNGLGENRDYSVPEEAIKHGQWSVVALRVYDHEGRGGFKGAAPLLFKGGDAIDLTGPWYFREGDDLSWALPDTSELRGDALYSDVTPMKKAATVVAGQTGGPLTPEAALKAFTLPGDLAIDLLLHEPLVAQPLHLSFDERGRLWVVQFRQYPAPAGLELVSHDRYWRAVYDKVPPPPPRHIKGKDRITIHEDTDGDGLYDKHKTFVDGLNIATAVAQGRGGVWVLNPPYLLFYPDRNRDDVPDGDPEVHLSGFGLEDTHSVINSLRWGPDGWLYAAQGSTVSATIRVEPIPNKEGENVADVEPFYSQGQNIWRYHPETRRYEIFSEGGGNAFGVEIDAKGRIFSGHNGGGTRGFHYMQGAYLRKGFNKHGELSNPFAYGFFPHMPHHNVERFTHTFLFYDGKALPEAYRGKLFGVEPLQGRVVLSDVQPLGSTFKTRDLSRPVTTSDGWFKPVDIKMGPDGALYIADWYDRQVNHWRNYQGNMDASNGRVYRLRARDAEPIRPVDLASLSTQALTGQLGHENIWVRQTALRVIADRGRDRGVADLLEEQIDAFKPGQASLEMLWAYYLTTGKPTRDIVKYLRHPDPHVRLWVVRLLGDERRVSGRVATTLARMAESESNIEVRAQLACTAKRLPAKASLRVLRQLLARDEDASDLRQPLLLWWAIEDKAVNERDAVLELFEDSTLWNWSIVRDHILQRLMRRYAATGTRANLMASAALLKMAPTPEHQQVLMKGFEEAFKGRSLAGLPEPLVEALADLGSPAFKLRQQKPGALAQALKVIGDESADKSSRQAFIEILGEVKQPSAVPAMLSVFRDSRDVDLRKASLTALLAYDDVGIGEQVLASYPGLPAAIKPAALTLLASRRAWSRGLVEALGNGRIPSSEMPQDVVIKLKGHDDPGMNTVLATIWKGADTLTTSTADRQIKHLAGMVDSGSGNPYRGKDLFNAACASCHTLFNQGGKIGPDLTTYQRNNVDHVLLSIVNPNAEIREGFENYMVETGDERSLSGFLVEQDPNVVVLRGLDGQNITLRRKEIKTMKSTGVSLMPEGLMDGWKEQQVRDFFAYLRSSQPLPE